MSAQDLDLARLEPWLREQIPSLDAALSVEKFAGGQSNPTFKLSAGDTHYVLRRKPPGELLASAHAVDREFRVLDALRDTDVPVPNAIALCTDDSVIGYQTWEFYSKKWGRSQNEKFHICARVQVVEGSLSEAMKGQHEVVSDWTSRAGLPSGQASATAPCGT